MQFKRIINWNGMFGMENMQTLKEEDFSSILQNIFKIRIITLMNVFFLLKKLLNLMRIFFKLISNSKLSYQKCGCQVN